jgi:hypothetical protein
MARHNRVVEHENNCSVVMGLIIMVLCFKQNTCFAAHNQEDATKSNFKKIVSLAVEFEWKIQ